MKKQIVMMAVLFVALGTANAQHDHGSHGQTKGSKDKAMHGDMQMKDGQMIYDVSVDFKHQLTEVYSASLELTDSFVSDKVNSVSISSTKVKSALGKVDMNLLNSSEAHMDWMMNLKDMNAEEVKILLIKENSNQFILAKKGIFKKIRFTNEIDKLCSIKRLFSIHIECRHRRSRPLRSQLRHRHQSQGRPLCA